MFKWTRGGSGLRRSGSTGASQTGRISGLTQIKQAPIAFHQRRRPAFLPDTPQEQTRDASHEAPGRVSGLEG